MKVRLVYFFALIALQAAGQEYDANDLQLISRWDDTTVVPNSYWVHSRYAGCTGWSDPSTGHEYAIIGSPAGTHFIDLGDPENPVKVDYVPGRRADCLWREYQTYSHYAYMVSDDAIPNSLQIVDLSYLPDSVHVVYDSDTLFARAHTIFIDGDKLYGGTVTRLSGTYAMAVYSLANPESPQLLRHLRQDYTHIPVVHDMLVRNDTVYASCGTQGLHIFLFNGGVFQARDSITTGNTHYNHSSALSDDGRTLYFCEEGPTGRPISVVDVSDLSNVTLINNFLSHQDATPHNPYLLGNYLFVAYYQDGLQVFDVSDPLEVTVAGYIDTYPLNVTGYNDPAYQGAWGAWPFLPSGRVLVSDMQRGLFVINADSLLRTSPAIRPDLSVFPNPVRETITVGFGNRPGLNYALLQIYDVTGRLMMEHQVTGLELNKEETLYAGKLAGGIYVLRATSDTGEEIGTVKFARQ